MLMPRATLKLMMDKLGAWFLTPIRRLLLMPPHAKLVAKVVLGTVLRKTIAVSQFKKKTRMMEQRGTTFVSCTQEIPKRVPRF